MSEVQAILFPSQWHWEFGTGRLNGTFAIALSFVFLAYFLDPAVKSAFEQVRARRAWRAIEKRQTVEVTSYGLFSEVFGGRRKWDAARIVAIVAAIFSVSSFFLELLLDLAYIENEVQDLHLRPPPVYQDNSTNTTSWHVIEAEDLDINIIEKRTGDNEWTARNMDSNWLHGSARATYEVADYDGIVEGVVAVARWSSNGSDPLADLFYKEHGAQVKTWNCSDGKADVYIGVGDINEENRQGTVAWCDGPQPEDPDDTSVPPPTLYLQEGSGNSTSEGGHVIVEESSIYPSFLYSLWTLNTNSDGRRLEHVFHIAASARLAEAVVTEVVHSWRNENYSPTGGGSFAWLRQFSEKYPNYEAHAKEGTRAAPFGERPNNTAVNATLSEIETIEAGVYVSAIATICGLVLLAMTIVGGIWSLRLRWTTGMDVYNRDELLCAVSMPALAGESANLSAMRIFVRKEDNGHMNVMLSDTGDVKSCCAHFFGKGPSVAEHQEPAPVSTAGNGNEDGGRGSNIPAGPRVVMLEGMRTGFGRTFPGPNNDFRYPTSAPFSPSPASSTVMSLVGTPVSRLSSPSRFAGVGPLAAGRGASILFESGHPSSPRLSQGNAETGEGWGSAS